MRIFALMLLGLAAASLSHLGAGENKKLPLIFEDDFSKGDGRWKPTDPAAWKIDGDEKNKFYRNFKQSDFKPPHRSPLNFALIKDVKVSDFELHGRCQSTVKDYGHRDMCLFFGYVDPAHFYYVHIAKKSDDHAHNIFIVNGEARKKISLKTTAGVNWTDGWHQVKLTRNASSGDIAVYFDDMNTPIMTANDKTFPEGLVGVGNFDDTGNWDDIKLYGTAAK